MIDWAAGYTATWRVMRVDPDTWEDSGELPGVESATVSRRLSSANPLIESAAVSARKPPGEPFAPGWHRVEMLAEQGPLVERVAVATVYLREVDGTLDKGADFIELSGTSVLLPADGAKLGAGETAPGGRDGAAYAAGLIAACTPAPVEARGSFALDEPYVFPAGTSHLAAARKLLDAAGWTIIVTGSGRVILQPLPDEPALRLDDAHARWVSPGIGRKADRSGAKNRYRAIDGAMSETASNDDPRSPTSHAALGFWNDEVDSSPVRVGGETLRAYAERRLSALSVVKTEYTYTRAWWPDVYAGCLVRASRPSIGFEGDLRVTSQVVRCDTGATVTETAVAEEVTYPWNG